MKTKLNLIPLSDLELNNKIDKSVYGTILVVLPVNFIKEVTLDSLKDGVKIERLAALAEVSHNINGDILWRPNRNTFRSHEFVKMEEHPWRLEPREKFVAYTINNEDYFKNMLYLSMGYTYNLDTNKWNEPKYTWEIINKDVSN